MLVAILLTLAADSCYQFTKSKHDEAKLHFLDFYGFLSLHVNEQQVHPYKGGGTSTSINPSILLCLSSSGLWVGGWTLSQLP